MRVNFLRASDGTPLSKAFTEIAPGTYKEDSYPFVSKFDSIERDVTTLEEFYAHVVAGAGEGLCLIKGTLDETLSNESRAGHTDPTTLTKWICLDVDYNVTDQTPTEFIDMLGFKDVSFIFQKSASMGIKCHEGWRGHFYVLLDFPQSPQVLKQVLIHLNLNNTSLLSQVGLSASGGALIYPLDVTTCQNDKLLYITPPICNGFDDPVTDRFELVLRRKESAVMDLRINAALNQAVAIRKIAELRKTNSLERKTFKITHVNNTEVLTNPDLVTVTGKKEERGFVYLNLNGGDSWGYYFPVEKPNILYNFKGEPGMYMRDVDKDILNEYETRILAETPASTASGAIPFGFLWPNDDVYYRGFANPDTGKINWLRAIGSKQKLRDFFVQNGIDVHNTWAVDEWDMTFDPTVEGHADFGKKYINTFRQSSYMLDAKEEDTTIPLTIDRVLTSVCVDDETKEHFVNWLASIFQTRQKTNTAWILQGVQGTGKGVLFTHILAPLLGRSYCHEMTMDRLNDDFNAYLNENFILFIDEANISDTPQGDRLLNRIKNLITEPEQHIRGMRRNAIIRRNYSNIILASNYDEIISMEISDRRFNVAPRQEKPLPFTRDDIDRLTDELGQFANYLYSYEVDQKKVSTVLLSEARAKLIQLSKTTIELFFTAINTGDLAYFTQYLSNSIKTDVESIRYHDFALIVKNWVGNVNQPTNVSRDDMRTCYQFLQNITISTTKFSRMCAKYSLKIKPVRVGTDLVRGVAGVEWQLSEEEREAHEETPGTNVTKIKGRA